MHAPQIKTMLLGAQMLFVAFGALVLVPILTGLDSNVALFTAGAGTLIFQWITKRTVPVFLASSFAFIPAIMFGVQTWGIASTMSGLMAAGLLYVVLSFLIHLRGDGFLHKLLPPIVIAPVIISIGLSLAPVGVNLALGKTGDGTATLYPPIFSLGISMFTLAVTVICVVWSKGLLKLIPILTGLLAGYILSCLLGHVDFTPLQSAPWFKIPSFVMPVFNLEAILFIMPIALAPAVEHIGDMVAISQVTGKDFLTKPGLQKTLLGDGVATMLASLLGGPPNTTYSEVTGAVALTKSFNPVIMTWASVFAIFLSMIGKTGALLSTIPTPVMGGILTLLFGAIAVIGIQSLIKDQTDLTKPRNMVILSIPLVFAVGGMSFQAGNFTLKGIALSALLAVILNIVLPKQQIKH